jgi:hypothetical protein
LDRAGERHAGSRFLRPSVSHSRSARRRRKGIGAMTLRGCGRCTPGIAPLVDPTCHSARARCCGYDPRSNRACGFPAHGLPGGLQVVAPGDAGCDRPRCGESAIWVQRAIAGKVRRQPWHCEICNLQNLKEPPESESHSFRQSLVPSKNARDFDNSPSSESNARPTRRRDQLRRNRRTAIRSVRCWQARSSNPTHMLSAHRAPRLRCRMAYWMPFTPASSIPEGHRPSAARFAGPSTWSPRSCWRSSLVAHGLPHLLRISGPAHDSVRTSRPAFGHSGGYDLHCDEQR